MPSVANKILQRLQGLIWGDGVKDSAVYFDGHTLVVDVVGRDANARALTVRALATNNAPSEVFGVSKDGGLALVDGSIASRTLSITASQVDVTTSESTTSTSYTDLTTPGPAVMLSPGTTKNQLLHVSARIAIGANAAAFASVAISGAAASDTDAASVQASGLATLCSRPILAGNVPSGSTHTVKYRVTADTGTFVNRRIIGVCL